MQDVVVFNATFDAECASFNQTLYKHRLAAALTEVVPEDILLAVTCGSVFVTFTILTRDRATAEAVVAELSTSVTASEAAASAALGASVLQVGAPGFGVPVAIPPTDDEPTDGERSQTAVGLSRWMIILIVAVGSPLAVCIICIAVYACWPKGRRRDSFWQPPTMARPKQGEKAAQSAPNFADIASVTSGSTVDVTDTMASFIPPPPPRVPPGRDMVYSLPAETDQKMM